MDIQALIRNIPDFPKPGIIFRDITTLLRDPDGLRHTADLLYHKCQDQGFAPDYVVGMESRGFMFAPLLAYQYHAGFVPIRKPNKLPGAVHRVEYELEYGMDALEIHQDAIESGKKVLIVDDLMATGGTAQAAAQLVQQCGGELLGFAFVIELVGLKGRDKLPDVPMLSLLQY
ncbi:adenine phosphoribosyltransferase [Spirulina sp. CS-785/01]|uniref:adenine phosphoribosyltransferase n=1 Tax=Spirulina sp. CS-785/01 TaxID=3021716 RepID=UPI0023302550|nr:adenine phosphoribosyltransferase [Spirulina sp. CS-785/01]MDB9315841.1 adenine phosphoribosyltransferase [Spirulina sp. CS-785/01]